MAFLVGDSRMYFDLHDPALWQVVITFIIGFVALSIAILQTILFDF